MIAEGIQQPRGLLAWSLHELRQSKTWNRPAMERIKEIARRIRLSLYRMRHGEKFNYHGIEIVVPNDTCFGIRKQLVEGTYEDSERRLVDALLDPSIPTIELGGSLGVLSAYVARKLRPTTPYWIVEANPRIIDYCRTNAATAAQADIHLVNCAVAYGAGNVAFFASDNAHVSRLASDETEGNTTVPAKTFRQLVSETAGADEFSLIMDIEGAEYDVFAHDAQAFARCRLAVVETHPHLYERFGRSVDDFLALVAKAGLKEHQRDANVFAFVRM